MAKTRATLTASSAAIVAALLTCGAVAPSWAATDAAETSAPTAEQAMPTMFPGSKTIPAARAGEPFEHRITYAGKTDATTADGLPAELSMDATGLITGRPTVKAGTYTFRLAAFDTIMLANKTETTSIRIEPGTYPGIEDAPPATIRYDQPYSFKLTLSGPGTMVRVSSGALPPGVSLTPDGVLDGRLTAGPKATYSFSLVAENDVETSAPYEFSVRVPTLNNFQHTGTSLDEFRYWFTAKETIAWNSHTCPEPYPYLIASKFAPAGSVFPSGALLQQPAGEPIWYSATATQRDGKQSGLKDLHMYNSTSPAFAATLVLHCTNDRAAAADY
jgi:hypothetical protein